VLGVLCHTGRNTRDFLCVDINLAPPPPTQLPSLPEDFCRGIPSAGTWCVLRQPRGLAFTIHVWIVQGIIPYKLVLNKRSSTLGKLNQGFKWGIKSFVEQLEKVYDLLAYMNSQPRPQALTRYRVTEVGLEPNAIARGLAKMANLYQIREYLSQILLKENSLCIKGSSNISNPWSTDVPSGVLEEDLGRIPGKKRNLALVFYRTVPFGCRPVRPPIERSGMFVVF